MATGRNHTNISLTGRAGPASCLVAPRLSLFASGVKRRHGSHPCIIDFQKEQVIQGITQALREFPLHLCRIVDREVRLAAKRVANRK